VVPLATAFAQSGGNPQSPDLTDPVLPTPGPARENLVNEFQPVRLVAPSIGMDASVVATDWTPGGDWNVPNGAAGWLKNSAVAGQPGNTVIAGHHNTQGEVFRHVADLKIGDSITVETGQQALTYLVTEKLILPMWGISPEQEAQYATWIDRTSDTRLTLITCWPYITNSHRVIVIAKPASAGSASQAN
jgi:sortase A